MINFEIDGSLPDGSYKIKLLDNPFEGIIVSLGKVSFQPYGDDDEEVKLAYNYDVIEHPIDFIKEQFVQEDLDRHIGDLLVQLLEEGVDKNNLVYTGGVDEN